MVVAARLLSLPFRTVPKIRGGGSDVSYVRVEMTKTAWTHTSNIQ